MSEKNGENNTASRATKKQYLFVTTSQDVQSQVSVYYSWQSLPVWEEETSLLSFPDDPIPNTLQASRLSTRYPAQATLNSEV